MGNCLGNLFPFQKFRNGTVKRLNSLQRGADSVTRKDDGSAVDDAVEDDRRDSPGDSRIGEAVALGSNWKAGDRDLGVLSQRKLYDFTNRRDGELDGLETEYNDECWLRLLQSEEKAEQIKKDVVEECFVPLTEEEEALVADALSNFNRRNVLVSHEKSGIDITGEILQCLRIGAWLNDEVINLYFELLKEREQREPKKFVKCHFFNTFFYKKLISGGDGYNFQAVRRWTTRRKLGYSLSDCEKIFVPIHKEIHWCLAIINKKDRKFQYLDSLRGVDSQALNVLARYYVDEAKDKSGEDINVSSWKKEFVRNLPEQKNGSDCGMFMIKYADFHSQNMGLCFDQGDMPYFRQRTAKEILNLKAE